MCSWPKMKKMFVTVFSIFSKISCIQMDPYSERKVKLALYKLSEHALCWWKQIHAV